MELYFQCQRREMPVAADTTDCIGCGMRDYPSPCPQYAEYRRRLKAGELGYIPEILRDVVPPALHDRPDRPTLTE